MTFFTKTVGVLLLALATIGCDRVSKHVAQSILADEPRQSFLGDTVRLEYVENTGAFLGLGAEWPARARWASFTVGNAVLLTLVVVVAVRHGWSGLSATGTVLFVSGGLSNLLDRALRGSVPDFLNVGVGPIRTGIFNVADIAIMLGVAFLLVGRARSPDVSRDGKPM